MNNSEFKKGQEVWGKKCSRTEPQKPVIPQFVADWIETAKKEKWWLSSSFNKSSGVPYEVYEWLIMPDMYERIKRQEIFARAWLDGYEVEKEQLYTVEIPNPNRKGNNRFFLHKDPNTGKILLCKGNFNPEKNKNLWLTESEIRKDFEWAWQWAKPVEE